MSDTKQYTCASCDYATNIRFNYDKHNKTKKHRQNVIQYNENKITNNLDKNQVHHNILHNRPQIFDQIRNQNNNIDTNYYDQKNNRYYEIHKNFIGSNQDVQQQVSTSYNNDPTQYKCSWCGRSFTNQTNLSRHKKTCSERDLLEAKFQNEKNVLQNETNKIINNLQNKLDKMKYEMNTMKLTLEHEQHNSRTLKETLEFERGYEKSHLSASNYLMVAYNNVPQLLRLSDFTIFEKEDMELIDLLLDAHREDRFVEFVGKALVEYYRTEDPRDQQLWNSDDVRLTYFIRKNLEWSIDKKGIKTCDLIIDPALNYFKKLLRAVLRAKIPQKSVTITINDNKRREEALGLINNIENGTVQQKILKYMAPYMYLDKQIKHVPKLKAKNLEHIPKRKCITVK